MLRPKLGVVSAMLLTATVLTGCSGSSAPKSLTIPFKSPALVDTSLPARYTCDGQDISPPMEWGAVPSTTKELVLFVLGLTPNPATGGFKTSVEWAVAGIDPQLHRIAAGELPAGAHVGETNTGKEQRYSVCPATKGHTKSYEFTLYAVPAAVTVPPGFVGNKLLRLIANPESAGHANAGGAFLARYTRPGHTAAPRRARTHSGGISSVAPAGAAAVKLESSAIHTTSLPALYTCDGRNIAPPLSWGALPASVHEVALFALGTPSGARATRSIEWAMAGVEPALRHLRAGQVPPGAFLISDSNGKRGYSLCPPSAHSERYTFALYALPSSARASAQITGPTLLHNLTEAGPQFAAPASGSFSVTYTRR